MTATGASVGIAIGPVYRVNTMVPVVPDFDDPAGAFAGAAAAVLRDLTTLKEKAAAAGRTEASEILGAQALMAEDPMLAAAVSDSLAAGSTLGTAIDEAAASISGVLAAMEDEYLAARSADVLEIADRIRHRLAGTSSAGLGEIREPVVVVASTLTAADTSQLDPELVLGFITEQGGPTSHVAVIARTLGIPAVVGAAGAVGYAEAASTVALDGEVGDVEFDPSPEVLADFAERAELAEARARVAATYGGKRIEFSGRGIRIAANIGSPDDINRAVENAADGVGLFRTEFLFLDRATPPTEDEQYEAYLAAVKGFDDPVVIRTLDIGGDKPASYLETPDEENPFLGERGVRLYGMFPDLFASQARALLRAAVAGDLWVMVPMVATVADLLGVKATMASAADELEAAGAEIGSPKIGVMIEVPSAAVTARALARHADFFSIGTNDLTQYTLAADRMNGRLADYSDAAHPAVLGLCKVTADAALEAGISVAVCGGAAGDPVTATLFAGMGMDKLSVAPPLVNRTKAVIDGLDPNAVAAALDQALAADSADEVRTLVGGLLGDGLR
jgi:phosphotransferase system enzyme I (PtsI)